MQNARSMLGRLSGLALFLIALLIVGLLVIFTVRSTNDEEGVVTPGDGETTSETTDQGEPVAPPDLDSEETAQEDGTNGRDGAANEGRVAGDQNGLPETGPEDVIVPTLIMGLLAWLISNYRESKRQLSESLSRPS